MSARALMGMSLAFHIVFATIGIGVPLLMFIAEGLYLKTKDQTYLIMAKRWARITAVLFAVGAVSGTILSFELGLLWPTFMDFSGPIIGFPLAMEGFAFFTEAIFLGLYLYGWDKLSPKAHWLSAGVISLSSALSALFIISVNSWMNDPAGFTLINGKAVNIDPAAAMFNAAMPFEVSHGTLAAYVAVGFGLAGLYAIQMLKGKRSAYVKKGLMLGMAMGIIAIPLQIITGDLSGKFVAEHQPAKFAAMEAQYPTETGAPLLIGGIPDPSAETTRYALKIPRLTSFLAHNNFNSTVTGLDSLPRSDRPDVFLVHYSFQIMVGLGFLMLFLALWFWVNVWRVKKIEPGIWLLRCAAVATPLGFIALELGWLVTEFGRQPWIIYGLMRTSDAATPKGGVDIIFGVFALVYIALAAGLVILLVREGRRPLPASLSTEDRSGS